MIESISISRVATYDETGIQIDNLKPINFIYGVNGTGKTVLSNFLQNPNELVFEYSSTKWKGDLPIKVLVYNKAFRDKNFGKGKTAGIFTLGQATTEEIKAIEEMALRLSDIQSQIVKKKGTLVSQTEAKATYEEEFKELAWSEIYKLYEVEFKEAFSGVMKKQLFKEKLLTEDKQNKSTLQTIDRLREKAKTIFGEVPVSLDELSTVDFNRINKIENEAIWKKKIIGKSDVSISALIQSLNINDWVNEGRNYLSNDKNICPFCQRETITKQFRDDIEAYFDKTYTDDINSIKSLSDEYQRLISIVINVLLQIEAKEKTNGKTKLKIELYSAYLKTIMTQLGSNKDHISTKQKEPSRSLEVFSTEETSSLLLELIKNTNTEIQKHNAIVANYPNERQALINEIWKYIVEEHKSMISVYSKTSEGLQQGMASLAKQLNDLQNQYDDLKKKIREANKNVTSVQPSIDEINRILKEYGFVNFEIVESKIEKNHYSILRDDGSGAETTLSEGEITFITFLYFLQLAKGSTTEENITDDRIIVVDDPISSLDSNILFVISSLLKEMIKAIKLRSGNIKQLIILTHNVYFHKEVSYVDGNKESKETAFWMIKKKGKYSVLQKFGAKNPIQNSYELLWNELKNREHGTGIAIQNTMRRIIENYFKLLGKYGDDDLIANFANKEEQEICRSLLCWINDGSHCIPDDIFIEYQENTIDKYMAVFRKIFVNTKHEEHYIMMMGEKAEIPE
jgi:wobble nucleotide-excising tRNase